MFAAGPSTQIPNGGKIVIEQEISDAIFHLTRRLHQLQSLHNSAEEDNHNVGGAGLITLAGHNNGATMNMGFNEVQEKSVSFGHPTINIYINNNVQGVNNSILYNSSCTVRDPGVHLDFSNSESSTEISSGGSGGEGKDKGAGDEGAASTITVHPDLESKAKKGRSYAGRKRSLSEVLSDQEAPIYDRVAQPDEASSSVNAQLQGGSVESSCQASSKVEAINMEIVMAENGYCRVEQKPNKVLLFIRELLCSTSVVE